MSDRPIELKWESIAPFIPGIITITDANFHVIHQFNAEDTPVAMPVGSRFLAGTLPDFEELTSDREPVTLQYLKTSPTSNGETRWLLHCLHLVPESKQHLILSTDVTQLRNDSANALETDLDRIQRRYQALMDNTTDGIAISGWGSSYDDDNLIDVNDRMTDIVGYTPQEIKAMKPSSVLPEEDVPAALQRRTEIDEEEHALIEMRFIHKDGSIRHVQRLNIVIRDEHARPVEIMVMARDITDLKQREEALLQARIAAEAALKTRDVFIASMSHELRSPLNTIQGYTQLLMEDPNVNPHMIERLRYIDYSAEHLNRLINDVLDLSRVEAGFDVLRPSTLNLSYLLKRLEGMLRLQVRRRNLELKFLVDPQLPTKVYMDEVKLKQILINLIDNAIKYTDAGTITVSIHTDQDQHLNCVITDTGPGIAEQAFASIFEPFTRGTDENAVSGTGLGLAISKRLIDIMGGYIEVHTGSEGTTVNVQFPYEYPPEEAAGAREAATKRADTGESDILVVDDRVMDRDVLTTFLQRHGFSVRAAGNGSSALAQIKDKLPDLLFIDLRMPKMDGLTTIQRIRQLPGGDQFPIIVITADAHPKDHIELLNAGCTDVISKPYRFARIADVISSTLGIDLAIEDTQPIGALNRDFPPVLSPTEFSGIAEGWLQRMLEICTAAQSEEALEHITIIEEEYPELASRLVELVNRFWMSRISAVIQQML